MDRRVHSFHYVSSVVWGKLALAGRCYFGKPAIARKSVCLLAAELCRLGWPWQWVCKAFRTLPDHNRDTFARQMRGFGKTWRRLMHESRFDEHTLDATHEDVLEVAFWLQQREADERWFDFLWKCAHYDEWDTAA